MKVSIVLRTYERPEAAKKLLRQLNGQSYKDFEVLLICQGDKKDLEEIKSSSQTSFPLKYCYDSQHNAPHARNVGIKEASGEIILFLDDDERAYDDLIEAHLADYQDPAVAIVGGKVLEPRFGQDMEQGLPEHKIGMVRKFDAYDYGGFRKNVRREVMHVKGGNMSVRKDIALEVGGFDERFAGSAEYEEFDFCLRVLKKGYKIIYEPKAVIEHFALPFGGCQTYTKTTEERAYWFYRNHSLAFLNNFNKIFYPILLAEYIVRIIQRSLISRNLKIIASGFRGIGDGWKTHFHQPRRGIA